MAYDTEGYRAYREIGVKTASQGKLVVMLYEGAVSHLDKAIALIGDGGKIPADGIESFGNHTQKVQDIITELQMSLDLDHGGDIAQNLMALYIYFNKELLDASINHDKERLSSVRTMLSDLRDAWAVTASSTANARTSPEQARPALNITG